MKIFFCGVFAISILFSAISDVKSQNATIKKELHEFKTYPFYDPNPVPEINRIYPYFDFDGYTSRPVDKKWKMVVLENDYIKVYVCPEIGGKVWGAIEKSTGKEFLYFNHVVKFRDVAMRGPWTSGGLEFNFGDIGHVPTCATPVDYVTRKNEDGSVSCIVGATDLPSGTKWNVEIRVSPDKTYFETRTSWFNGTSLPCTYYHWMNAAAKASGNLELIYPGNKYIGHGGEPGDWPVENGREISWYEKNNFGGYKSYHVINSYTDFFGGYWHEDDFGFGHWANYDEIPGKKLWIWGLSQQGLIWENLLTDNDGQYIEFQSGKLFNQAAAGSSYSPFKHKEFSPHDADVMNEIWFPLKETGGMVAASPYGVLNVTKNGKRVVVILSALQPLNDLLTIKQSGKIIKQEKVVLNPLESKIITIEDPDFIFDLGDGKLHFSSEPDEYIVDRPVVSDTSFNWESAYGLYAKALELEKQRRYDEALVAYLQVIEKDAGFVPALNRLALGYYRMMDYEKALGYVKQALSIDTYDGEANYLFGLISSRLGNIPDAKSGFSIASYSVQYRSAALTELSKLFLKEKNYIKTLHYAEKALSFNSSNHVACQLTAIAYRKNNDERLAKKALEKLNSLDATCHFISFENYLLEKSESAKKEFLSHITNELPSETFLDLAVNYYNLGMREEALMVLDLAPEHPVVNLWQAALDTANEEKYLEKAVTASPYLVFPFRNETADILLKFNAMVDNWKLKYYLGLIYWNRGMKSKALELFDACADTPDYYPFWLAKVKLTSDNNMRAEYLAKARELAPDDWRPALAMTYYYIRNNKAEEAVKLSKEFTEKFPEQSSVGLSYARSLMKAGDYQRVVRFLKRYNILPFEGATAGRDIYHEACIRMAFKSIKDKNYRSALKWADFAREWPPNLGVGKPYDVDERLEDFIMAYSFKNLGMQSKASTYFGNIAHFRLAEGSQESSKLYLQLYSLEELGKESEAQLLVDKLRQQFPGNLYIEWAAARMESEDKAKESEMAIRNIKDESQPYDIKFRDREFDLLIEFLEVL